MTATLRVDWKVAGLLPQRLGDSLYFNKHPDPGYVRRVFGKNCHQELSICSLSTTKQFHQRFSAELRKEHGCDGTFTRLPYLLNVEGVGPVPVGLRLRLFGERILVATISLEFKMDAYDLRKAISVQKITDQPVLMALARFSFNVHFVSPPSKTSIRFQEWVPLMKVSAKEIDGPTMVRLVTRHETIEGRAAHEVLKKNETINFDSAIMLLDKQGLLFAVNSKDTEGQRNRYSRMSNLYEFVTHILVLGRAENSPELDEKSFATQKLQELAPIMSQEVLRESVSASRGWELMKREFQLKSIAKPEAVSVSSASSVNWSRVGVAVAVIGLVLVVGFNLYG